MPKGRFAILAKSTSDGGHFLPDRFLPPVGSHWGCWVFPGASRVAGGVHFGVHLGIQQMAEPQTILSAVLGKRKNAPV